MSYSNYVPQWHFTEDGSAYDLTKITSINRYETLVKTPKVEFVVVLDNGKELLISPSEASELIIALQKREQAIERIVNRNE